MKVNKEHQAKFGKAISTIIFFGCIKSYFVSIHIILQNTIFDFKRVVVRLYEMVKFSIYILIDILAVICMVCFVPFALPIYIMLNYKKRKGFIKDSYSNNYLPDLNKLKHKILPKRKHHQKYFIEDGYIYENYLDKLHKKQQKGLIVDARPLLGVVSQHQIPKLHLVYLMTELNKIAMVSNGKGLKKLCLTTKYN